MHSLGETRSANRSDHLLHTPDTFVRIPLPCLERAAAIVHVGPVLGAAFSQMTVEFEAGGKLLPIGMQRFLYVIEGELTLTSPGKSYTLGAGGYAYVPASVTHTFEAAGKARASVIERAAEGDSGAAPQLLVGLEEQVAATALMGDADLQVRTLLPAGLEFDFAVNTMTYQPGAALSQVEVHVMEHGLLMLEGGGIYRLGNAWYPVTAGDFIWMAPFCPQWFGAIGKTPAKYLIYKDWNRHPLR